MERKAFIDAILNDDESSNEMETKGMCQRCGHYTVIFMSRVTGIRVCKSCENQLMDEMKKDFL